MIRITSNPIVAPVDPFDLDVLCHVGNLDRIHIRPGFFASTRSGGRLSAIKRATAFVFGVTVMALEGQRRAREIAWPRHAAFYAAKHLTGLSYPQIGNAFGGRDHTTVMHGLRVVPKRMARYPEYKAAVEKVMEMVE